MQRCGTPARSVWIVWALESIFKGWLARSARNGTGAVTLAPRSACCASSAENRGRGHRSRAIFCLLARCAEERLRYSCLNAVTCLLSCLRSLFIILPPQNGATAGGALSPAGGGGAAANSGCSSVACWRPAEHCCCLALEHCGRQSPLPQFYRKGGIFVTVSRGHHPAFPRRWRAPAAPLPRPRRAGDGA